MALSGTKRRLALNLSINVSAQVLNRLFPLLAYGLAQSRLGNEAFGYALFAMTLVDFTSPFIEAGTGMRGSIAVGRDRDDATAMRRLLGELLAIRAINAAFAAVGLAAAVYLFYADYAAGALAVSYMLVTGVLDSQYVQLGTQRLWTLGLLNTAAKAVILLLLLITVHDASDAIKFAVLLVASNSLLSLGSFVDSRRRWPPLMPSRQRLAAAYRTLAPFSVLMVLAFVHEKFDFVLVEAFLSKQEVGLYGGMSRAFVSIQGLLPALTTAFGSEMLSERNADAFARQIELALAAMALVVAPLVVGAWFAAGPLLELLFDASYAAMAVPFAILCASTLFYAPAYVVGIHALLTRGRVRLVIVGYGAGIAVGLAAGVILVPRLGATGGALAVLLAKLTLALVVTPAGASLVDFRRVARLTLRSAAAAGLMGAALWYAEPRELWQILAFGGGIYAVAATALNASWLLPLLKRRRA